MNTIKDYKRNYINLVRSDITNILKKYNHNLNSQDLMKDITYLFHKKFTPFYNPFTDKTNEDYTDNVEFNESNCPTSLITVYLSGYITVLYPYEFRLRVLIRKNKNTNLCTIRISSLDKIRHKR